MGKKEKGKSKRDAEWAEAKRRCRLNQEDIRMAKELGLAPRSLIKNIPAKSQPWKAPVKEWIRDLYERRLKKAAKKKAKQEEDSRARLTTDAEQLPEGTTAMVEFPLSVVLPEKHIHDVPDIAYEVAEDAIDISHPDENGPFGDGEEWDEEWMEENPFFEDDGPPSPKDIREQDQSLLRRQQKFRAAAEAVARAFSEMPEVQKVMLFGSVAVPLKKEVPRFREYRRAGIEVWHECKDVDLAVWLTDLTCLRTLQKARTQALKDVQEKDGACVTHHQVDIFILDPKTDRYLGRLCNFGKCPKGKDKCRVPGCGEMKFLQKHENFVFKRVSLRPDRSILLFDRSLGTTVEET